MIHQEKIFSLCFNGLDKIACDQKLDQLKALIRNNHHRNVVEGARNEIQDIEEILFMLVRTVFKHSVYRLIAKNQTPGIQFAFESMSTRDLCSRQLQEYLGFSEGVNQLESNSPKTNALASRHAPEFLYYFGKDAILKLMCLARIAQLCSFWRQHPYVQKSILPLIELYEGIPPNVVTEYSRDLSMSLDYGIASEVTIGSFAYPGVGVFNMIAAGHPITRFNHMPLSLVDIRARGGNSKFCLLDEAQLALMILRNQYKNQWVIPTYPMLLFLMNNREIAFPQTNPEQVNRSGVYGSCSPASLNNFGMFKGYAMNGGAVRINHMTPANFQLCRFDHM